MCVRARACVWEGSGRHTRIFAVGELQLEVASYPECLQVQYLRQQLEESCNRFTVPPEYAAQTHPGMLEQHLHSRQLNENPMQQMMTPQAHRMQQLAEFNVRARQSAGQGQLHQHTMYQQQHMRHHEPMMPHPHMHMQAGCVPYYLQGQEGLSGYYLQGQEGLLTHPPSKPLEHDRSTLGSRIAAASHACAWDGGDGRMRTPDGRWLAADAAMEAGPEPKNAGVDLQDRSRKGEVPGVDSVSSSVSAKGSDDDGRSASARTPRSGSGPRNANPRQELPRYRAGPRSSAAAAPGAKGAQHSQPPSTNWAASAEQARKAAGKDIPTSPAVEVGGVKRGGRGRAKEDDPPRPSARFSDGRDLLDF